MATLVLTLPPTSSGSGCRRILGDGGAGEAGEQHGEDQTHGQFTL